MGERVVRALDGISLEVVPGEFLGVVGRSGSGKSTLLNLLAGLDRPSSGSLWVGDRDLTRMSPEQLAHHRQHTVGIVFQFFHLIPTLTALQNVELPMAFSGLGPGKRADKARSLMENVGLSHRLDHVPSQLSGGEQQRVSIARSLANDPQFLLADEPTGNLDSATAGEIQEIFKRLHLEGRTVICVTHEQDLWKECLDRVIELRDGRLFREERLGRGKGGGNGIPGGED
jgi:putative ABC transport system ATP-binding protein